jgi:antitoxin component HigA of HigAB toxin-antitoxin module
MMVDDLVLLLGSKKAVTEVMNGKKALTLETIRTLTRELGISVEALVN